METRSRRGRQVDAPARRRRRPRSACASPTSSSSPSKRCGQPVRHARAGLRGEICGLLEVLDRHDARHDRNVDPARANLVEIAEIDVVIEEELGDRAVGAGIDLRSSARRYRHRAKRLPDAFPDRPRPRPRNRRRALMPATRSQVWSIACRDAAHRPCRAARQDRRATPRHGARRHPNRSDDLVDFVPRRGDTGQMRGRLQRASPRTRR